MTNSHNRSGKGGNHAERYFNNHSPQQWSGNNGKRNSSASNSGGNGGRAQKSPSSTYFRSISTSNSIPIVKTSSPVSSKGGNYYNASSPSGRPQSFNINTSYQRLSPGSSNFTNTLGTLSGSPPNFSHFAGSKCYDAPAPTALPKPPVHWTSSTPSITTATPTLNTSKTSSKPASIVARITSCKSSPSITSSSSSMPPTSRVKVKSAKPAISCAAAAARTNRNADFTYSLKTILNVQA